MKKWLPMVVTACVVAALSLVYAEGSPTRSGTSLSIYVQDAACGPGGLNATPSHPLAGMTVQVDSAQQVTTSSDPVTFKVSADVDVTVTVLDGNGYVGRSVTVKVSKDMHDRWTLAVAKFLTGTVTDSAGNPVGGANVTVTWMRPYGQQLEMQDAQATTDGAGHFSLSPPWPEASYTVSVVSPRGSGNASGSPKCGVPTAVSITVND